jgi:probable phosphoglycerate mutase
MRGDIRIHLVRHAETVFNVNKQLQGWCDSPLTARGDRQAAALGELMRSVPLTAAFMSDLTRTRTTMAAALIGHPTLKPRAMRELREWHFGSWEGKANADLWTPVFADQGFEYGSSNGWAGMTADGPDLLLDTIYRSDPLGRAESALDVSTRTAAGMSIVLAAGADSVNAASDSGSGSATGSGWGEADLLVVTHGAVMNSILHHLDREYRSQMALPNCGVITVTIRDGKVTIGDVDGSCAAAAETDLVASEA